MGMDFGKYDSELQKCLDEAEKIRESFHHAKLKIKEEYEVRNLVLRDVKGRYKRISKAFKRGEVDEETLLVAKKDLQQAGNIKKELDHKLQELDRNEKKRLEKVVNKIHHLKQKYVKEIAEEKKRLRYQLMKAKHDFLKNLIKDKNEYLQSYYAIREEYLDWSDEEYYLENKMKRLGLEAGLDQETDQFDHSKVSEVKDLQDQKEVQESIVQVLMDEEWQKAGAVITDEELQEALLSGKVSQELEEELENAVINGYI
ncbi:hypothetical protein [Neobacillus fumarioli]|uniref:hypothetical protein n=1 Tax=Neobacillus fumarioli TaxID=105229 RepID=UPI000832D381|nr:hypothetical protein [Neobacillus fumarioli]